MEIEVFILNMKEIYPFLMDFLEATSNVEYEFQCLISILEKLNIYDNQDQIHGLLELISKITINRHRTQDLFNKLSKIFHFILQEKNAQISSSEMIQIFENDKRLLLLLLEEKFVQPDKATLEALMNKKDLNEFKYEHYLYPGIKDLIDEPNRKRIEGEISKNFNESIDSFEKKCRIGENDSYVSSLIRQDSIEEFVSFVNRTNFSLSKSRIKRSIFETNLFLIENDEPTLIEYASFFGSIKVFNYLRYNRIALKGSLWLFTIHSNNGDLIHLLEENHIEPDDDSYEECVQESIKCHFNDVANYIKDNLLLTMNDDEEKDDKGDDSYFTENFASYISESYNFNYTPSHIEIANLMSNQKNAFGFNISNLCFSIKVVTIPSSVTSIGEGAFEECSSLRQVNIPLSVKTIGFNAFNECTSLTKVEIPSSVASIGKYAFSKCSSLKEVIIPSSVTSIGIYAFSQCSSLVKLEIPSSITTIEMGTFCGCKSLKEVKIPSSVTSIGDNSFSDCLSLMKIEIPSSVSKMGGCIFSGCSSLADIKIPSSVKMIGYCSFSKCSSLTRIEIPSSVSTLGKGSFKGCPNLVQITFEGQSSLTSISEETFCECISLNDIVIPSTITIIEVSAFDKCKALTKIIIPHSVTTIGRRAFNESTALKQIEIPSSVKVIDMYAFAKCKAAENLIFEQPSSCFSIDRYAFSECTSLKIIDVPSSMTTLQREAFVGCSGLRQISIPAATEFYPNFGPKVKVIRT